MNADVVFAPRTELRQCLFLDQLSAHEPTEA